MEFRWNGLDCDAVISQKLENDPARIVHTYDKFGAVVMASTFDRYLHADMRGKKFHSKSIAMHFFSFAFGFSLLKFNQIGIDLVDLVLLRPDQPIQRNNKRAMRLHLQQQPQHTMHKERATTRRHIKRRPHREPMQVSIH